MRAELMFSFTFHNHIDWLVGTEGTEGTGITS